MKVIEERFEGQEESKHTSEEKLTLYLKNRAEQLLREGE